MNIFLAFLSLTMVNLPVNAMGIEDIDPQTTVDEFVKACQTPDDQACFDAFSDLAMDPSAVKILSQKEGVQGAELDKAVAKARDHREVMYSLGATELTLMDAGNGAGILAPVLVAAGTIVIGVTGIIATQLTLGNPCGLALGGIPYAIHYGKRIPAYFERIQLRKELAAAQESTMVELRRALPFQNQF